MPPQEGDEEKAKEGTKIKILTSNKLLTRHPVLLAPIETGNNSYKPKNETRQTVHLLYQHNKVTRTFYNSLIKLF